MTEQQHPRAVAGPDDALPAVPWLPSVLRRAWRAPGVLQIGVEDRRAVVLRNVTAAAATFIGRLDGSRAVDDVIDEGPLAPDEAVRLLTALDAHGVLVDLADEHAAGNGRARHPALAGALSPEIHGRALGRLSVSPSAVLEQRARAHIVIVGGNRLATAIAAVLAGSGIGRLGLVHAGAVTPTDLVPGGPAADDVGRPRQDALRRSITRAYPRVTVGPVGASDCPDLVVLAEAVDPCGDRARMLMRSGTRFLNAVIRERRGIVGPFVVPGESSCLECQDAVRRDLDPHWSPLASQLRAYPPTPADGGELCLVMLCASLAVTQVLQWLDSERLPETLNATLEIALPELVVERRYWPRHTECPCRIP
ncbi:ThiF family adenylyltransferase [Cumulibacter manganitolerans]|uniref:ThiF family adenylyltransferase n=1 Tax=Cumulibacter manganitolerans TaxID=1884992 RepID=UPI001295CE2F|nr:ThiF family adenylyltransferase [Cumulibacter manganitolerans]